MKKHSFLALVLLGVISLGCVKEIPDQVGNDETGTVIPGSTGDPVTVTTTITLPDAAGTKALTAAGVKTFAPGDEVAVVYAWRVTESEWWTGYFSELAKATLSAEDISNDGKSAKISVSMNQILPDGKVRIIYPANMLNLGGYEYNEPDDDNNINYDALATQDGTLASLASNLDLAVYDGRREGGELPGNIQLENRLAIGEFTVKDDSSNDITSSVTRFTVSDGTNTYTVYRAASPGPIYLAMKPVSGNLNLTASDGDSSYEKNVTGKTFEANKMYPIGVTMDKSFDARVTPLTFEAITAGAEVSFKLPSNTEPETVQYRLNDGAWNAYTSETHITLANVGDKVQFRGKNSTYYVDGYDYGQFSATADCYLYGNIMSLVSDYTTDGNAFESNVTLTGENTFYRLFRNNTRIKSHASKPLMLPATTLTGNCYHSMFYGCTGLTTAPALPATTLASDCYSYMFYGCTGLTTAPALPATTLAPCCYDSMFNGCNGLTTPPALPATTLAGSCYSYMFNGCTGLTTAPALPATILAGSCYVNMFRSCTGLTTAPALPATTLEPSCYRSMFYGCIGLTVAPALPATTLVLYCYENMFDGCTNLNSLTCYALSVPNANCISKWLRNTSGSGTLLLHPALNPDSVRNNYAVPNGWNIDNHVVATKALAMASWEDVGRVIGADGNVYSTFALAEAAGTTAEAMIAYLGAVDGVCEHGLAVSLTDVSVSEDWDGAAGAISTWASSHTVPGCSWRLPSFKDWQYLIIGAYTDKPEDVFRSFINVLLSGAGGVQMNDDYWSSTSLDEDTARYISVYNSGDSYLTYNCSKDHTRAVRACLSF